MNHPAQNPYDAPNNAPNAEPSEGVKRKLPWGQKQLARAFAISAIGGFLIWVLSPIISGQIEPWDSRIPYYIVCMLGIGFCAGWFGTGTPRQLALTFAAWIGVWLGQVVAVGTLPWMRGYLWGPLWLWAIVLAFYSVSCLPGFAAGSALRAARFTRRRRASRRLELPDEKLPTDDDKAANQEGGFNVNES